MKIKNRYSEQEQKQKKDYAIINLYKRIFIAPYTKKDLIKDLENNKIINTLNNFDIENIPDIDITKMSRFERIDYVRKNKDVIIKKPDVQ